MATINHQRSEELDWEHVRFFVALADFGSLSAVARALRVNHSTVSRRIAGLEDRLERVLFERTRSGYALTRDGRRLAEKARAMADAAAGLLRMLDVDDRPTGLVRLTTTPALAEAHLVRRLAGFARTWPSIDLVLIADTNPLSLHHREADIAVRIGRPEDGTAIARRIGRLWYGYYAAPGVAVKVRDAIETPFIAFDADSARLREAAWFAARHADARVSFRSNSQIAQVEAAVAGFGVALLPSYLAIPAGLVEVEQGTVPPPQEIWLLMRPDLKNVPRIRAVADFLIEAFAS